MCFYKISQTLDKHRYRTRIAFPLLDGGSTFDHLIIDPSHLHIYQVAHHACRLLDA